MNRLLALALMITALPLAACGNGGAGGATDSAAANGTTAADSAVQGTPLTTGADAQGDTAVEPGAVTSPAGGSVFALPYPGSRVVSSVNSPTDNAGLITFQTDADPGTVIAYYRQRAEEAGLTPRADLTMGDTRQFGADTSDGGELSVEITPQDNLSTVTVTWEGVSG